MIVYGLSLSVGGLSGDPFVNFCMMGGADCVSKVCLILLVKIFSSRRKPLTILTYVTLGLTCLTIGLLTKLSPQQSTAIIVFFIIGKFLASIAITMVFLLLTESFPTECRLLGKLSYPYPYLILIYRWYAFTAYLPLRFGFHSFLDTKRI